MKNFPKLRFISTIQMDHFDTDDFEIPNDGSTRSAMLNWFVAEAETLRDRLHDFEVAPLATLTVRKNLSDLLESAWTVSSTSAIIKELHTGLASPDLTFALLEKVAQHLLDQSGKGQDIHHYACLHSAKRLVPMLLSIASQVGEGN